MGRGCESTRSHANREAAGKQQGSSREAAGKHTCLRTGACVPRAACCLLGAACFCWVAGHLGGPRAARADARELLCAAESLVNHEEPGAQVVGAG